MKVKKHGINQLVLAVIFLVFVALMGCAKTSLPLLIASVSENYESVTVVLQNCPDFEDVQFPTWSIENGQDDLVWYPAEKNPDGNWTSTVELKKHNSGGAFQIDAYGTKNDEQKLLVTTYITLPPDLMAIVSDDCKRMIITFSRHADYSNVQFPIWSEVNGQDDIVWYTAEKNADGNWIATVDLSRHDSAGIYQIHAYGIIDSERKMLGATSVNVAYATGQELTADVTEDYTKMLITFRSHADYNAVYFPVWNEENGQDDIVWYLAEKDADGNWIATVDLSRHDSAGIYQIHAYGIIGSEKKMLGATSVNVAYATGQELTADVTEDCTKMLITFRSHADYEAVYFPVWSEENGQDDITWYLAEKDADGNWIASVDLKQHDSRGVFIVHVYGSENGALVLLDSTSVSVMS